MCAPWKPPKGFTRVPLALPGALGGLRNRASVETEESLDKLHLHSPKPSNLAEKSKKWLNVPKCQST